MDDSLFALPPQLFAQAFPFHFVLNRQRQIIQAGKALQLILPEGWSGSPVEQYFQINRPTVALEFDAIRKQTRTFFLLQSLHNGIQLKGQMMYAEELDLIFFLGSPWITDPASLTPLGLKLKDFAIHDPTVDLLFLLQAKNTALTEAKILTEQLTQRQNQLQNALQVKAELAEIAVTQANQLKQTLAELQQTEAERKAAEERLKHQAQQLEQANLQLAEYSQTLEQKVESRTQELSQALAHLQATQQELIQSGKMAVLGQLTASIAHEINTPLGVIRAATANISSAFADSLLQLPSLLQHLSLPQKAEFLNLVQTALQPHATLSTREERRLRRRLQTELEQQGIAEAGTIATQLTLLGITADLHPYQFLLSNPHCLAILKAAYNLVLQQHSAGRIQQEVDRAAKIVFALKTYTHQDYTSEKVLANLTEGLEVTLALYQNRLKQGVEVVCHYQPIPNILCDPDALNQVWVNLVDNALHAMKQQGKLEIEVFEQNHWIMVTITDSGCGIPAAQQQQIFEPFFTTKPRGEGSGLGLDIVQQIIQQHGGQIQVQSQPGRTTFTVQLPLLQVAGDSE